MRVHTKQPPPSNPDPRLALDCSACLAAPPQLFVVFREGYTPMEQRRCYRSVKVGARGASYLWGDPCPFNLLDYTVLFSSVRSHED